MPTLNHSLPGISVRQITLRAPSLRPTRGAQRVQEIRDPIAVRLPREGQSDRNSRETPIEDAGDRRCSHGGLFRERDTPALVRGNIEFQVLIGAVRRQDCRHDGVIVRRRLHEDRTMFGAVRIAGRSPIGSIRESGCHNVHAYTCKLRVQERIYGDHFGCAAHPCWGTLPKSREARCFVEARCHADRATISRTDGLSATNS